MTPAAVCAAGAAGLGAVGLAELLGTRRGRGRPRDRRAITARGRWATALLIRLGRRAGRPAAGDLQARLDAAGVATPAADVAVLRAGAAVAGLLAVLPLAWAAPGRLGLALLVAGPAAGHLGPSLWLGRRIRRRAAAVERELGDVLDLLRVALGAGLGPMRALAEVGRRHPGVLAAELRRAAARRALGVPAATVLAELERRAPGEGVTVLCAALRRADRHGAPLAGALEAQARQARSRAAARTAEAAARAAPRIQLVVALLLVPAVLLLVAAALLPAVAGAGR
jgi:tight adherence protein C